MICNIAGNFEAGNSLNLAVTAVVAQQCTGNSALLLTSDVIQIAAMLPAQRFWREIVSFLDVT